MNLKAAAVPQLPYPEASKLSGFCARHTGLKRIIPIIPRNLCERGDTRTVLFLVEITGLSAAVLCVMLPVAQWFQFRRSDSKDIASPTEASAAIVLVGTFSVMLLLVCYETLKRPDATFANIPNGDLTIFALAVLTYFVLMWLSGGNSSKEVRRRLARAQEEASEHPDNLEYSWNLASATLQDYLERNVSQVKWIFNVSVIAMFFGLGVIAYGACVTIAQDTQKGLITVLGGVFAQFISATFLWVYRSTVSQAKSYVTILERITNLGIAMQVLKGMGDRSPTERTAVETEIIRRLISNPCSDDVTYADSVAPASDGAKERHSQTATR